MYGCRMLADEVLNEAVRIPCIAPVKHCALRDITAKPIPATVVGSMTEAESAVHGIS